MVLGKQMVSPGALLAAALLLSIRVKLKGAHQIASKRVGCRSKSRSYLSWAHTTAGAMRASTRRAA